MGEQASHGSPNDDPGPDLAEVVRRLQAVEDENRRLTAALESMSSERVAAATPPPDPQRLTRRGLILGGAGAVAASAVAVVASATPAAANGQGQSLTIGDSANTATSVTGLSSTKAGAAVLQVTNASTTGIGIHAIAGTSSGGPVIGASSGAAVVGDSNAKVGVYGASSSGTGVRGVSSTGFGVEASSTATALSASSSGTDDTSAAIAADGGTGGAIALQAVSAGNDAIQATSSGGTAIAAYSSVTAAARLVGDITQLSLLPSSNAVAAPPTTSIAHSVGDFVSDGTGDLWFCVVAGTPGTWRKLTGPAAAGAFHVLPAPARVYDSRPGTSPSTGPKTPLIANHARPLTVATASSGLPADASAAVVNLLVVNASAGNGNFTIWADGVARPAANNMVWGGSTGRFSSQATTALDASGRCQVQASVQCDFVLDVVGYYR